MKLLKYLGAMAVALLAMVALASCGSKAEDIAVVKWTYHTSLNEIEDAIVKEIKTSSYTYKCYDANAKFDNATQIMQKLKNKKVKNVVCIATPVAVSAQSVFAGTDTKIIFSAVSDPSSLVSNYDAPESNITGTSDAVDPERLVNLSYTVNPSIKKIGYMYNPQEANSVTNLAKLKALAATKGFTLVEKTITKAADANQIFASMKDNIEALIITDDNTVAEALPAFASDMIAAKIPSYCAADSEIKDGGMMGYSINYTTLGKDTGAMAVKLAGGAEVSSVPVKIYKSEELGFYYNSNTVISSKISIPEGLLSTAKDLYNAK